MSNFKFLVSKDKYCKFHNSLEPDEWKQCLSNTHVERSYTIVYIASHLDEKKFDCGCIIFDNKYYPEFKLSEHIFKDFFKHELTSGQKLIKFDIKKADKK